MSRRVQWLLVTLGAVGALVFLVRYKKGGQEFAIDAVEEVMVTAQRIGAAVSDAFAGSWLSKVPERFMSAFASARARYGLPARLLERVAYQESRFREDIISGQTVSSAGAVGLMQIVPKWHPDVNPRDPIASIDYAGRYLRQLFTQFGSWRLALAAYNWGPGNLSKSRDPANWPRETRDYVSQIAADVGLA